MNTHEFITGHIKRNMIVYQISIFIFRMFIAGMIGMIFLKATNRIEEAIRFFDFILLVGFGFNTLYMKRLIEFSETALNEIGQKQNYSEGTNIVIRMIIKDARRLTGLALLMALMGILVEACAIVILWSTWKTAGPLELIVGFSFILIGIPVFALAVSYWQDARSLKKINDGGNA